MKLIKPVVIFLLALAWVNPAFSETAAAQTIAALRAQPVPVPNFGQAIVTVVAEYSTGVGVGGGLMRWNASATAADDGCIFFNPIGNLGAGRWERIFTGPQSPDECGAYGNGVTDDLAAVRSAAVAFKKYGLSIPRGRIYRVTGQIPIYGTVSGHGEIVVDAITASGLVANGLQGFEIAGLKIKSTKTTGLFGGSTAGISILNSEKFKIWGVEVSYFTDNISITASSKFSVDGNSTHDSGEEPIVVRTSTAWAIENNDIFHHNGDGILIKGAGNQTGLIQANTIHDGTNVQGYPVIGGGITCNSESGLETEPLSGLKIVANTIFSTAYGIGIISGTDFSIVGNKISDIKETKGIYIDNSGAFNPSFVAGGKEIISSNSIIKVFDDEGIVARVSDVAGGYPVIVSANYVDLQNVVQNAIRVENSIVSSNIVTGGAVNMDLTNSVASGNFLLGNAGSADNILKLRGGTTFSANNVGTAVVPVTTSISLRANFSGAMSGNSVFSNSSQPAILVTAGASGTLVSNAIKNAGAGGILAQFGGGQLPPTISVDKFTQLGTVSQNQLAAPTTGTWKRGDIVYFSAPTAGGKIGAICTVAGTPGTWKTWGAIDP
jgi:hypothetical protein